MIPMKVDEIAHAAGASLLLAGSMPSRPVSLVATDTRSPVKHALFIALKGERFDAHDFLESAIEKGAAALLVARIPPAPWSWRAGRGRRFCARAAPWPP